MSDLLDNIPQARSWREIPQPVKPRTMSAEGRWRLAKSVLRVTGVTVAVAALGWGAWTVTEVLRGSSRTPAAAATSVPVKNFVLKTGPDGVLDKVWLQHALALPKNVSLMELDLEQLRGRLLAYGQVSAANVTLRIPDTIVAEVAERSPVARVMALAAGGEQKALLVARDGVVFEGVGFDSGMLNELPLLDGVRLVRNKGGSLQPIEGMETTANLLAKARNEAGHLYRTWTVVSLERLRADREIEVRTQFGTRLVFAADGDYFPQLFRLNATLDALAERGGPPPLKIDLSLGREVAVTPNEPAPAPGSIGSRSKPSSTGFPSNFLNSQPKT